MAQTEGPDVSDESSSVTHGSDYQFDSLCTNDKVTQCLQDTDNVSQQTCKEVISSAVFKAVESVLSGQDQCAIRKKVRRRISKALTQSLLNESVMKRLTGRKSTEKVKQMLDSLHKSFSELQTKLTSTSPMAKDQCESADLESRVCKLEKKALGLRERDKLGF